MTEQQIAKLVASLVEHQAEFAGLSTSDAQWAIQHAKAAIALCVKAIKNRPGPILTFFDIFTIRPAETLAIDDDFVASHKYPGSTTSFYIGEDFIQCFLGKIEARKELGETNLCIYTLNRDSEDGPIIDELGEIKAETSLAEVIALIEATPSNRLCGLYTDKGNNFYVRDVGGVLRVVRVMWRGNVWSMEAIITSNGLRIGWSKGDAVFAR